MLHSFITTFTTCNSNFLSALHYTDDDPVNTNHYIELPSLQLSHEPSQEDNISIVGTSQDWEKSKPNHKKVSVWTISLFPTHLLFTMAPQLLCSATSLKFPDHVLPPVIL